MGMGSHIPLKPFETNADAKYITTETSTFPTPGNKNVGGGYFSTHF